MYRDIVFTHTGNHSYLYAAMLQAKHVNDGNVHLIGDESNSNCPGVKHIKITDLERTEYHNKLIDSYIHLSPNSIGYELFCFERWCYIHQLMVEKSIVSLVVIDSDFMLYKKPSEFDFSMVDSTKIFGNAFMLFVPSLDSLTNFIRWMIDIFINKNKLIEFAFLNMVDMTAKHIKSWDVKYKVPLFSDMICIIEYMKIHGNGSREFFLENFIDENVNHPYPAGRPDKVAFENNFKTIKRHNGKIFYCNESDGSLRDISGIHFAQTAKAQMVKNITFDVASDIDFLCSVEKDPNLVDYLRGLSTR